MSNKITIFIISSVAFTFLPLIALAHQPRLVESNGIIQVKNPEISQAFYGQLNGIYQDFKIDSAEPFNLYVNVLAPDLPMMETDMSAEIFKLTPSTTSLAVLDGDKFNWTKFYEPFAGDNYLKGPEFRQEVGEGQYLIRVFSSNYKGKYSLVVGEQEFFSLGEYWQTLTILPALKKDFFNKSLVTMFFNYIGLYLLGVLLILAAVIFFIWRTIKRYKKAKL
ncbi:MAG: hypothetical protein UW11_C0043G0006 [Parcubacteria group bacterium GW2011_GWA2_43_9b]|uniref:Uncharacterized protein n=1 Tax=Candidatus Portnoybacteria bacterium RIFCSPLOWO2_02_FULL_39_11 TaxID=1802001 RepID=A0A1G2FUB6_9BACT|nr:MAG: hypothetical protein UW11_C0043G0006 [Parcubacteria group bacterium GW2011_GWA2_43_9b]OGZ41210.1 MAG: hypothetical protein A3B04_00225 [Candidatus Portnoybacteria bacterium RIFCSPLOWO2_02_FULL_39_11]